MMIQIDLHDIKKYFFFFKMNKNDGFWLEPIDEIVEFWPYCFEVIAYEAYTTPISIGEKYDGSQEKIDYTCDPKTVLLNFEFPDEETALYFKLKFGAVND